MKLVHLSDLHLGKRVNEFSMIEDQKYILKEILTVIGKEQPDGVIVAGDVYDRSVPGEDAMMLWDDFLGTLALQHIPVFAISGNHDSAVRLSDHGRLVNAVGIYLSPVYNGECACHTLTDEHGPVNIYLLPFVKPAHVRAFFPDEEIKDYTDACRVCVEHMNVDPSARNILVAHQFVTGAVRCESEEIMVGGLDNVDASVFDVFDYVALGHIHGKQKIGRETVRYCGTPLKYSFSEKDHKKSITIVEMGEKGDVKISERLLTPRHDLREIRGSYNDIMNKENYEGTDTEDYVHVVLTDEEDVIDAAAKIRTVYHNLMKLSYDNKRTASRTEITGAEDVEKKSPLELFEEFYEKQNNQPMSDEQRTFVTECIEAVWKEHA
ncbi:MAG: exonuclease SbcCD subunit D [Butyrivibrio sp.]|nr:exonuclease SbcCD subunit D [Butyrivibrio sp.]